jgi:hypothetical protein
VAGDGEKPRDRAERRLTLNRRQFLALGGSTGASVALVKFEGWQTLLGSAEAFAAEALAPSFTVSVVRPADLVNLTFLFYNLQLSGSTIVRVDSTKPAYLAVQLPGQNIFEQPWNESSGSPPATPLGGVIAGPSRLVFAVPSSVSSLPFTLAGLLDWSSLAPSLAKGATGKGKPRVLPPGPTVTALETPWNLVLSPDPTGRWATSPTPVTADGWTELWHARLGTDAGGTVVEPPGSAPAVRAIWSPDYPGSPAVGDTFALWTPTSLTSNDRSDLVKNTADWTQLDQSGNPYTPMPAAASAFTVSALGATIDVAGAWPTAGTSLKEWRQRTYLGRDTYVKRVYFGYLFPTGHPATLTIITDREFAGAPDGTTTAYLVQRTFVTVRQPVVDYTTWPYAGPPYSANADRGLPFASIRALTLSTPPLDTSNNVQVGNLSVSQAMWITEEFGPDVPFRMVGTDWAGNEAHFDMTMIFVAGSPDTKYAAFDTSVVSQVIAAYDASGTRRDVDLGSQPVAFAPEVPGAPGATTHPVTTLHFSAVGVSGARLTFPDVPWWVTSLFAASPGDFGALVTLQAVGALTGSPGGTTPVTYHPTYLTDGFSANGGAEIWATVLSGPTVTYSADQSGGVATPNLNTSDMGLSRQFGLVPGASQLAPTSGTPTYDPASLFDPSKAALLGSLHLPDIMQARDQTQDPNYLLQVPQLQQGGTTPDYILHGQPAAHIFKLAFNKDWKYEIAKGGQTTDPLGLLTVTNNSKLAIGVVIAIPDVPPGSPPADPVWAVDGRFDEFGFNLFGTAVPLLNLQFQKLIFHLQTGQSPQVTPDIDSVSFPDASPLHFLSFLTSMAGGDSPFSIKPAADGLEISFTLPIPNLTAGALTISNMKFKFQLTIPYSFNEVTTEFAFSEKDHPATLAVWIFGGGFYVDIKLCLLGIQEIEAALEFGVTAQLDFGVASGGCHVLVGIYFDLKATYATDPADPSHILPATETVNLQGYFRAGGDVKVLGIVDISIELYLGLGYVTPGKAYGIATLTLKVSVLFFSASVSVQVEKTFSSGSGSDPNFGLILTKPEWTEYCEAFAA